MHKSDEWLIAYRLGMDPVEISSLSKNASVRTVERFIAEQLEADPTLFDTRLWRCLEPALPVFRDQDVTGNWEQRYNDLVGFIREAGHLPRYADPSTTHGAVELFLANWVRAQRREAAAGRLKGQHERALETVPGWVKLGPAGRRGVVWKKDLEDCRRFAEETGRAPDYRQATTSCERQLGMWLNRQQARRQRGVLPMAMAAALDDVFPS
ncbi:helicase associated domain-containing protein [Arthrobacter rhombi]|uniref:helicase associated domain-containing protein n=1 Tax=Arthrobacter rhombi TaxID=71253 RepID=UPI003FD0495C